MDTSAVVSNDENDDGTTKKYKWKQDKDTDKKEPNKKKSKVHTMRCVIISSTCLYTYNKQQLNKGRKQSESQQKKSQQKKRQTKKYSKDVQTNKGKNV